ncbi:hypothetical protein KSP40_PGU011461 [Platanthera guangdongensis]|uniref:Uncharacterized protein n=1 Tax=Platanthera guangdongensis TaxID=2320717 RepID=A0ABR2MN43_9ASPA
MDGKKGRPGAVVPVASSQAQLVADTGIDGYGDGLALGSHSSLPGSGGYGGFGIGSSLYRTSTGSSGIPSSIYPEAGPYSTTSSMYQVGQHLQPAGSSPGPRIPPGSGMYQSITHYF